MQKHEADKLLKLGEEALNKAEYDQAIYLLQKSLSLHESDYAHKLLTKAKNHKKHQAKPAEYSAEEESLAKEIISKSNYYEILNLPKDANQDQVKKAYRKIVIKLHPDKNKAPSANHAFTVIQKAYECLSDESRREHYDNTGADEDLSIHFDQVFTRELFIVSLINFFSDCVFLPSHYIHRWYNPENAEHLMNYSGKIKMFPIIMFLLLTAMSGFYALREDYALKPSPFYDTLKVSQNINLDYYVNLESFQKLSNERQQEIDKRIENFFLNELNRECEKNRNFKASLLNKAKQGQGFNSKAFSRYADQIDLSSCEKLETLINR